MSASQQLLLGGVKAADAVYVEDVFSTWLYTGNGSTQTINNGIDLAGKGGLVWIKARSVAESNQLVDTARGNTKYIVSNNADSEDTVSTRVTSFNANGFSLGSHSVVNGNGNTFASWTFREQPKFFDVVTYTGNGTSQNIAHNLGSVPGCIIVKDVSNTRAWSVYHTSLGNTQNLILSGTNAAATAADWNNTTPTSTVFTVGTNVRTNASGATYVAYLFAHNAGGFGLTGTDNVISCGSFTTDGSGNATVNLGYEPQWILAKRTSGVDDWYIWDTMRGLPLGGAAQQLIANNANAEESGGSATFNLAPTATGFRSNQFFGANATYIYIAIRRGPMRTPTTGTSVFAPLAVNNALNTVNTTGFPVDMQWYGNRDGNANNIATVDRLRGVSTNSTAQQNYLRTASTAAEVNSGGSSFTRNWSSTGFSTAPAQDGANAAYWNFRRAPGFFDVVCYTGNSVAGRQVTHNLTVAPELLIVKRRTGGVDSWYCYAQPLGNTFDILLDSTRAASSGDEVWFNTSPTSTNFTVRQYDAVNGSGFNYVAYLFATCPGVSKVGSYTGTSDNQTINCGFTTGARFVMIKRIDGSGSWYVWDSARGIVSGNDPYLRLNLTSAEIGFNNFVNPAATGFEITSNATSDLNALGGSFLFLAIA